MRADRSRVLLLANQRIAQNRLLEPAGDSARHYVDLLRASDPNFEGLADTRTLLATRALDESRKFAAAGNLDRADSFLRVAADAGAPDSEVTAITAQITAAPHRAAGGVDAGTERRAREGHAAHALRPPRLPGPCAARKARRAGWTSSSPSRRTARPPMAR